MKIKFEIELDDVLALRRFEFAGSWDWHAYVTLPSIFGLIPSFGTILAFVKLEGNLSLLGLAAGAAVGIAWTFVVQKVGTWFYLRQSVTSLAGTAGRMVTGWHEMELRENQLFVRTELMECTVDLRGVQDIVRTESHAFIQLFGGLAYIVPLARAAEDGSAGAFVAELRYAWENRASGPPTEVRIRPAKRDKRIEELQDSTETGVQSLSTSGAEQVKPSSMPDKVA